MKSKQNTTDILSQIDHLISMEAKPRQPDEFTLAEYMERQAKLGIPMSDSATHKKLKSYVDKKILSFRKTNIDGASMNVYKVII